MPVTFIEPLNLQDFQDEGKIYRTLSIDRAIAMFDQGKFTFLSPSKWEDPYEKGFLTMEIIQNRVPMVIPTVPQVNPVSYNLFAQCWTGIQESEAFWRVRSPQNDGVNIGIDTQTLYTYLNNLNLNFYIGKVQYLSLKQIFDPAQVRAELAQSGGNNLIFHLRLLLRKRLQYRYEQEYRIFLYKQPSIGDEYFDILPFNPCQLIHRIMLHPKIGKNHETLLKNYFKGKCGQGFRVIKSKFGAPILPINLTI